MAYRGVFAAALLVASTAASPLINAHVALGSPSTSSTSSAPSTITTCGVTCNAPASPGGCREQCFLNALAEVCINDTPECRCQNMVFLKASVDACVDLVPLNVCLDIDLTLFGSTFDASCSCIESAASSGTCATGGAASSPAAVQTPTGAISAPSSAVQMATSTVYATQVNTITKCAPTVTNCPASERTHEHVVTQVVAVSTTVCPVKDGQAGSPSAPAVVSTSAPAPIAPAGTAPSGSLVMVPPPASLQPPAMSASNPATVVMTTQVLTITSCGPEVTNCPAHNAQATPAVGAPPFAPSAGMPMPSSNGTASYTPGVRVPVVPWAGAGTPVVTMTGSTPAASRTASTTASQWTGAATRLNVAEGLIVAAGIVALL